MAKINDLQCIGDALIQGDLKVNGKFRNEIIDVDNDCIIIQFCKKLDLSTVGNSIQIDLPDGYVCNSTAPNSYGAIGYCCYDNINDVWSVDAYVNFSCVNAQDDSVYINGISLSHQDAGTRGLVPFAKSYIKAAVQTAAVGTNPAMIMYGTIYCRKES